MHTIPERVWRRAAQHHAAQIRDILRPGLTPPNHPLNTGLQRQRSQQERKRLRGKNLCGERQINRNRGPKGGTGNVDDEWDITALDPKNPVFNFLIEYYGLKGTKGVRRLMKWPPGIITDDTQSTDRRILLLHGATEQDFLTSLLTKGSFLWDSETALSENSQECYNAEEGIVYSPFQYVYGNRQQHEGGGALAAFRWYQSLLEQTLDAAPVMHCYGLHEWAMQYQPVDDRSSTTLPPSSKYQSHLQLRIDQQTLNETVESNTLYCTHVDAWKFFAKEALPLNHFCNNKSRKSGDENDFLPTPQDRPKVLLVSEQPACVHTTMDLLKIALKLGPFCDPHLFCRVLSTTIAARSLDVAASPYDAKTMYGVDPIPIETPEGRNEYKRRQLELMKRSEPVRIELLENYRIFLSLFDSST